MQVIRILIYEGTVEFVARSLDKRAIKGCVSVKDGTIFEAIVGDVVDIMKSALLAKEKQEAGIVSKGACDEINP